MSYHVLALEADHFKRLKAVRIVPAGNLIEVSGENGEGKSSTLDAIWAALGGKDACPDKPIHTGETKAEVRLLLGENGQPKLQVTRKFRLKEGVPYATDLIVETPEGARFEKAQSVLDTLVGSLCFDPLAFTRLPDKDQITALRKFVPEVDFATIEGLNKRDFDGRADINRDIKSLKGQLDGMPLPAGDAPERVDTAALESKLAEASDHNSTLERRKAQRQAVQDRCEARTREIAEYREMIAKLEALNAEDVDLMAKAEALPEPIDVSDVRAKLEEGRRVNLIADQADQRKRLEDQIADKMAKAAALTETMAKRKENAAKAVKAAKMPIAGLGFAEDPSGAPFISLNEEPLRQASQAQQIRASVAIAAAMNPQLRVAMIKDGSLLDKKSWAALAEYAVANDLQIWAETVDPKSAGAVIIEDGGNRFEEAEQPADLGDVV